MKKLIKYMMLFLCILLMTGCSNKKSVGGKNITTANSVDKIINEQINNENKDKTTDNKNLLSSNDSSKGTENVIKDTEGTQKTKGTVDYDLTQMSSDLVYATVYQMMVTPEEYEGKMFRIDGNFYAAYYKATKKYCFYCLIQDATACCGQRMEFVWGDGTHIYPEEYPEDNAEIVVEGIFETYREEGEDNLYCRLSDATLQNEN